MEPPTIVTATQVNTNATNSIPDHFQLPRLTAIVSNCAVKARDKATTTLTQCTHETKSDSRNAVNDQQKVCSRCTAFHSCAWHRSKTTPRAYLCETCYRLENLELCDKRCSSCSTKSTSRQWYKSKLIGSSDLCKRCYRIELVALQRKNCVACTSNTTSGHWYKSKLLIGSDLCNNCYGKEYKLIKRKRDEMTKFASLTQVCSSIVSNGAALNWMREWVRYAWSIGRDQ